MQNMEIQSNRLSILINHNQYYISDVVQIKDRLFLMLKTNIDLKTNVICVNKKFELLHVFNEIEAFSIATIDNKFSIYFEGYNFYFDPETFEKLGYKYVK